MSFHQYSWNSEVDTTWISLIHWHHKKSSVLTVGCIRQLARVKTCMGLIKVPKHTVWKLIFTTTKKGCLPVPNIVFSDPLYVMPHCFVSCLILNRFIGVGDGGSGSSFFSGKNKHILMIWLLSYVLNFYQPSDNSVDF